MAAATAGLLPHRPSAQQHYNRQQSQADDQSIVVVSEQLHDNIGVDGYQYNYQLSDGQQRDESAELINAETENEAIVVRGSYSWVDSITGQEYKINYFADENGFHAEGAHIPKA